MFKAFLFGLMHICKMTGTILTATIADIPELLQLINSAYRGEEAKKGWTHEADLFDGAIRTDETSLKQLIEKPGAVILKYEQDKKITGCVFLEKRVSVFTSGCFPYLLKSRRRALAKNY